jgi:excisionase family DNA binding protein
VRRNAIGEGTVKLLYTVEEVAEMLSVSRHTIYKLVKDGELESVKVRGARRVLAEALEAYVAGIRA